MLSRDASRARAVSLGPHAIPSPLSSTRRPQNHRQGHARSREGSMTDQPSLPIKLTLPEPVPVAIEPAEEIR